MTSSKAQFAYISAVSGVASQHIQYILDRTQLFLDLELLTVGDDGFWQQLYDEQYQPTPAYQLPSYSLPAYGYLHPHLKYSHKMKRMLDVPTGTAAIFSPTDSDKTAEDKPAEDKAAEDKPAEDKPERLPPVTPEAEEVGQP